jgi:hypothetical protein
LFEPGFELVQQTFGGIDLGRVAGRVVASHP